MKKLAALILTLALAASLTVPALASEFSDVPADHNFHDAIAACSEEGIVGGYSDGTFRPSNTVTRSNFCVMLSRAFYADSVAEYSTPVYLSMGNFVPNARALYANGILENTSFVDGFATGTVMNQPISRYDMAQLMTNIMDKKGLSASAAEKSSAAVKISDYSSIPSQYKNAVANVFALGLIGGYSDGTFRGTVTMNRGQAAVVIYRMSQRVPLSSSTPSESPVRQETPVQPDIPVTPTEKTLRNGKPATEANVIALLNELKSMYPEGTSFASGYTSAMRSLVGGGGSTDVNKIANSYTRANGGGKTSTTVDCGGWAAFVSDYIFGTSGMPARKITAAEAHPGDIVISLNGNGKLTHVSIAIENTYHDDGAQSTEINTTDANRNGDHNIYWTHSHSQWDNPLPGDYTIEVWTRYPD